MQIHKSCEISDLKRPFCSSVDPDAAKIYCTNEHDDDDYYLDNKKYVACSRHRNREC
jgi:hypothetical protein